MSHFCLLDRKTLRIQREGTFKIYSRPFSLGVSTNRDSIVYDFNRQSLEGRVRQFCDDYNADMERYQQRGRPADIDTFVNYEKIQWSSTLKNHLRSGVGAEFDRAKIRTSLYRPFTRMSFYYDSVLNDRPGHFQQLIPNATTETENRVICVNQTAEKSFGCLVTNVIPNLVMCGGFGAATQCFPYYVYNGDGSKRRDNITDWALQQFRTQYLDELISKWDIFHYVYAVLHHPQYREKYAANLKRELPRMPFAPDFHEFVEAGARLAELHIGYEIQPEYPLQRVESKDEKLNWRVERMRLSKDRTQIVYNNFLTLGGIPLEVYEYWVGNRSALEWVIDQYRIINQERSGIINDPNRADDPEYIVHLIGKVIAVSLETVRTVKSLPSFSVNS